MALLYCKHPAAKLQLAGCARCTEDLRSLPTPDHEGPLKISRQNHGSRAAVFILSDAESRCEHPGSCDNSCRVHERPDLHVVLSVWCLHRRAFTSSTLGACRSTSQGTAPSSDPGQVVLFPDGPGRHVEPTGPNPVALAWDQLGALAFWRLLGALAPGRRAQREDVANRARNSRPARSRGRLTSVKFPGLCWRKR